MERALPSGLLLRRIGGMKISMRESIEEGIRQLPQNRQDAIRERLRGYEDAIEDVLTVLREYV